MVSVSHINAEYYYQRDLNCILTFFERKFKIVPNPKQTIPKLKDVKFNFFHAILYILSLDSNKKQT